MTENNKIGPWALSGLIIGPILGSGILILPPLIVERIGRWAIFAWMIIIGISFLFAFILGHVSIRFPGEGGVTNAVAAAFGIHIKQLTSIFLIIGVIFGAVAVLMTAANYVGALTTLPAWIIGYILLYVCTALLLTKISFIGQIALIMSLVSAAVLFSGGVTVLNVFPVNPGAGTRFDPAQFGYAVLLLFWTIFGWEVIGNYSAEVKEPRKTIPKAILISAAVIATVELTIAAAVQRIGISKSSGGVVSITPVITSVFHGADQAVIALMTLFLCASTYLLFAGSVARLIASMASQGITRAALPAFLGKRSRNNTPLPAVVLIFGLHNMVFFLFKLGVFNIEKLIALSNGFFIANALICLGAGIRLIENRLIKASGLLLGLFFLGMLLHYATSDSLIVIGGLSAYYVGKQWLQNRVKANQPV